MRFPIKRISKPVLGFRQPITDLSDAIEAVINYKDEAKLQIKFYGRVSTENALRWLKKKCGAKNWKAESSKLETLLRRVFNNQGIPEIYMLYVNEMMLIENKILNKIISTKKSKNLEYKEFLNQKTSILNLRKTLNSYLKFAHPDHEKNSDMMWVVFNSIKEKNPQDANIKKITKADYSKILKNTLALKAFIDSVNELYKKTNSEVFSTEHRSLSSRKRFICNRSYSSDYYFGFLRLTRAFSKTVNPKATNNSIYELVAQILFMTYTPDSEDSKSSSKIKKRLEKYKLN